MKQRNAKIKQTEIEKEGRRGREREDGGGEGMGGGRVEEREERREGRKEGRQTGRK